MNPSIQEVNRAYRLRHVRRLRMWVLTGQMEDDIERMARKAAPWIWAFVGMSLAYFGIIATVGMLP